MANPTRNPWVALPVATDPVAHAAHLRRAHEREITSGGGVGGGTGVREVVRESWKRSIAAGVAPDAAGAPLRLSLDGLELARERSPLAPAVAAIHSTLSTLDDDAQHIVAIGDAQANLLWVTGAPAAVERSREMRFQEGASWAEEDAGTNAVGTAAALDHSVQIFSAEHLVAAVHPWTCSAAPIHEPATGELIGVVDVTAALRTHHPHTLSLVALAAQAAEHALYLRSLEITARLREQWEVAISRRRTPSALLDAHGRVIASRGVDLGAVRGLACRESAVGARDDGELEPLDGGGAILWLSGRPRPLPRRLRLALLGHDASARLEGGRGERGLRSLELLALLAMRREGMTAEQLALALYGERGKAVTVRAQIHRVRAFFGRGALRTQPYALNVPIDADWIKVRRLVAAGRPSEALRAYRGPLLPASDAPAIVEERGLLEESLRRAILTSADPKLLMRWLAHPSGATDLAASRALVAVLPCGDPRRAAATALSAALARRVA